jgi:hypothetical protein
MTDSALSPRRQRLAAASLTAATAARTAAEARRGKAPAVGDRCVLPATSVFPVEWVLIDQRAAPPAFLAVLADIHPLVGSADLIVAPGALRLRCRTRVWLDAGALAAASIVGGLDRVTVEKVRRRIQELERDADPQPAGEIESSVEYQDWQRDVVTPALAAAGSAVGAPGLSDLREEQAARRRTEPARFMAAASVLLVIGLAGWAGLQSRQIDLLAMEKQEAKTALERERTRREQASGQREQNRQSLAETARQATNRAAELEGRLARLEETEKARNEKPAPPPVLENLPLAILNPAEVLRGEEDSDVSHFKMKAPYMAVVLNVDPEPEYPTYRAVLKREGNPAPLWQSDKLVSTDQRIQLLLDSSLLSPGAYRFDLYGLSQGRAESLGQYDLAIDR